MYLGLISACHLPPWGKTLPQRWGCKCPVFLSRITVELCISSLSLWLISQWVGAELLADESGKDQSRVSQQGSLWRARETKNPREAGDETEQGL